MHFRSKTESRIDGIFQCGVQDNGSDKTILLLKTLQLEDYWREPGERIVGHVQASDGIQHHVLAAWV